MNLLYRIDRAVTFHIQRLPQQARPYLVMATRLGYPAVLGGILVVVMTGSWALGNHQWVGRELWALLLLPLSAILKLLFRRVRPDTMYVSGMRFRSYSFPSGHAQDSMMVLGLLAYAAGVSLPASIGLIICFLLLVLIACIGVSRIYLGAHFPTDVIGGWVIGAGVLAAIVAS